LSLLHRQAVIESGSAFSFPVKKCGARLEASHPVCVVFEIIIQRTEATLAIACEDQRRAKGCDYRVAWAHLERQLG